MLLQETHFRCSDTGRLKKKEYIYIYIYKHIYININTNQRHIYIKIDQRKARWLY